MDIIKASLMAAVSQGGGSHTSGICDEIKAMPICGDAHVQNKYSLYLKYGSLSEQAESIQQMAYYTQGTSLVFYPRTICKQRYFFLCVYPYGVNPSTTDFYEALVCSNFVNNSNLWDTTNNYIKSDYTGYYAHDIKSPIGFGATITTTAYSQGLNLNVSCTLNGAYVTTYYDEDGTIINRIQDSISSTNWTDIGRDITGTGYENYTKLSQSEYEQYLLELAEFVYNQ